MATQYWSQLPPWMQDAIMNNTWTKMIGRVNGPREARLVSSMFNNVTKDQVLTLGSYTYLAQVSANKTPTQPFTLKTLPPLPPAKMRKAYHVQNHGALQHPSDNGATPYNFFQGISEMGHGDRRTWEDFRDRMPAAGVNQRAEFLAELSEDDFNRYKKLQRQRDLEIFHALLDDPDRDPEFVELTREEIESLDDAGIKRVKRVRALSSLKVEVPREIVLAEDIRLRNEMDESADVFDELLL